LRQLLAGALRFDHQAVMQTGHMTEQLSHLMLQALLVIVPMGLLMAAVATASAVASGGWNLSFKAVSPDFTRFNPISGLGRMFNKQHLIDLLKMATLAGLVGVVGYKYLQDQFQDMASLLLVPLPQAVARIGASMAECFGLILLVLGAWALVDVPLQRYLWASKLKMSREEAKQEFKEAEGNMEVKNKLKARMREMSRKRMLTAVPAADLVVMNPTHFAVALKYDDARMGAPRVVAKGADLLALRIRDIAREAKVPVLQAPPLARALYTHVELDQEVPAALFAAVAQVLAWVYQLRRSPDLATSPPSVNVPPELDPYTLAKPSEAAE
jgi:flagellar biosynthetic protein FlhB